MVFDLIGAFRRSNLCVKALKSRVDVLEEVYKSFERREQKVLNDEYTFADIADDIEDKTKMHFVVLESTVKLALGKHNHPHPELLIPLLTTYFVSEGVAVAVEDIEHTLCAAGLKVRRFYADPRKLHKALKKLLEKFCGKEWLPLVEKAAQGEKHTGEVRRAVEGAISGILNATSESIRNESKKYKETQNK